MKRQPTANGVAAAAVRVAPYVTRTPLLPILHEGRRVWVKAECLQQGGSFKLRGATNRLLQLDEKEREKGVVAFSSGNHGLGVAMAAERLGISATIVMPADAPAVKRESILACGARIVEYDRRTESREEISAHIAAETGAIIVPSFDDPDIIEGQGTVGVEIADQVRESTGALPDLIIAPCGGGGLISGIALANPKARVVPVEPAGWDDMARSLEAGALLAVEENAPNTHCDALQTKLVSPLTFTVLRDRGVRGVAVSEQEIARAIFFAARHLKIVAEPGGAVALAAVLAGKVAIAERTVIVVSGGNVDPLLYSEIIRTEAGGEAA